MASVEWGWKGWEGSRRKEELKSATRRWPEVVERMLWGFRSEWMMLWDWSQVRAEIS